jgi:hypothetical protein
MHPWIVEILCLRLFSNELNELFVVIKWLFGDFLDEGILDSQHYKKYRSNFFYFKFGFFHSCLLVRPFIFESFFFPILMKCSHVLKVLGVHHWLRCLTSPNCAECLRLFPSDCGEWWHQWIYFKNVNNENNHFPRCLTSNWQTIGAPKSPDLNESSSKILNLKVVWSMGSSQATSCSCL